MSGYSPTERELEVVSQIVRANGVRTVLEFGPGRSTEYFLRAGCEVWSCEYQARWLAHWRSAFGSQPRLRLGAFENKAEVRIVDLPSRRFDLAFIDAPTRRDRPEGVPYSRLNTALAAARHCDLLLLHDADRDGERATVEYLCASGWRRAPLESAPRLALLRRVGAAETVAAARAFDFSGWPTLPRVSCQCITYGRTTLLDESVESFLRQDYPGESELVILNDLPDLRLQFKHPRVRVVNLPCRLRTVGEKRNACVALCTGEVIFPWDDDDISLPHRISYSLSRMADRRYYKADRFWYWASGHIKPPPRKGVAHAMSCWAVEFFDEVGGYPHIQSGQDTGLEERFQGPDRIVEAIDSADVYYIYRFPGTHSYHLSAHGHGHGYDEAARHVDRAGMAGDYEIAPTWRQDYLQLVRGALEQMRAERT